MEVLSWDLSLRLRNFFNKDPGHRNISCVGVSTSSIKLTITNPQSHVHLPFVDVVAVPFNMADAVGILRLCFPQEHDTVNWQGSCTFSAVESEIPAFAAPGAAFNSQCTSPVNMEGCVSQVLCEHTVL